MVSPLPSRIGAGTSLSASWDIDDAGHQVQSTRTEHEERVKLVTVEPNGVAARHASPS